MDVILQVTDHELVRFCLFVVLGTNKSELCDLQLCMVWVRGGVCFTVAPCVILFWVVLVLKRTAQRLFKNRQILLRRNMVSSQNSIKLVSVDPFIVFCLARTFAQQFNSFMKLGHVTVVDNSVFSHLDNSHKNAFYIWITFEGSVNQ